MTKQGCASLIKLSAIVLVLCGIPESSVLSAGEWITSTEGAKVWKEKLQPNETCSWSGHKNKYGYAHGPGMLVWFQSGVITQVNCGNYDYGHGHGICYLMEPSGNVTVMYLEHFRSIPIKTKLHVEEVANPSNDAETARWFTTSKGVKIWNNSPQPNETCSWFGDKDALGYATGSGMVVWYQKGKIEQVACGPFNEGRGDGVLTIANSEGKTWIQRQDKGESFAVELKYERVEPIVRAQTPSREPAGTSSGELTTGQKVGIAALAAAGLWLMLRDNDKSTASSSSPSSSSSESSGRMVKRLGSCTGCGGDGKTGLPGINESRCRRCGGSGLHDEWTVERK